MSSPFVGEIRMFAGTFAPQGWALCDGQLLQISSNDALFSLLGTIYGGDGRTTFGLPDLRGRIPIHTGQGPGLSNRSLGQRAGEETVHLSSAHIPTHSHAWLAHSGSAQSNSPTNASLAASSADVYADSGNLEGLHIDTVLSEGSGAAHNNLMPSLAVNFIISLFGVFPSPT